MGRTQRRALISGITGQDGSYLAELLLAKDYEVHGVVRRVAAQADEHRYWRIDHIRKRLHLHGASLESYGSLFQVVAQVRPDEIYHLAAQSFVSYSFEDEFSTLATNINGTHHLLAAAKELTPQARFYFAATSEMFGDTHICPQNEQTPFHPRSSYAISKVTGFDLTRHYREAYGLFAVSGILFNHESPRRGFEFVTRKITSHVAKIKLGLGEHLALGNLDARRDWGHARDYVRAMWLMLQQEKPDDYVIGTGETNTVRTFLELAFGHVGLDYQKHVVIDPRYFRPTEVNLLRADCSRARRKLGWEYSLPLPTLVREMVDADLAYYSRREKA
jgi:GDPmannose 4,6-dehydratase